MNVVVDCKAPLIIIIIIIAITVHAQFFTKHKIVTRNKTQHGTSLYYGEQVPKKVVGALPSWVPAHRSIDLYRVVFCLSSLFCVL